MTKAQRHKYYKKALKIFELGSYSGVCFLLCIATGDVSRLAQDRILDEFPEFANKKPRNKISNNFWWPFTPAGNKKRLSALNQCIKETEPKFKK